MDSGGSSLLPIREKRKVRFFPRGESRRDGARILTFALRGIHTPRHSRREGADPRHSQSASIAACARRGPYASLLSYQSGGGLGYRGFPPSQVACVLPRIKGNAPEYM